MAKRWAVASGNWSSSGTWNDGGILGVPATGDEVWSNSFTVAVDQDISVMSLSQQVKSTRTSAISQMTGYTGPEGTASANTELNGTTNAAWRAFDGTTNFWSTFTATVAGILQFQFNTARVIRAYDIVASTTASSAPRNWTLEGSNNGSSWTTIDTKTGITIGTSATWQSPTLANTTAYLYYRLNITANQGATTTTVNTLNLYDLNEYQTLAAGGQFTVAGNRTIAVTGGTIGSQGLAGATGNTLIHYSGGVGTTLNLNLSGSEVWASTATTAPWFLTISNSGNLVVNGAINWNLAAGTLAALIRMTSAGTITILGNVTVGSAAQGTIITATSGSVTIVGNVNQISTANSNAINFTGSTLAITGNVSSQNGTNAISTTAGVTISVTGNVTSNGAAAAILSTGASTITVVGDVQCNGTLNAILSVTSAAAVVNFSGNARNNSSNGQVAILSSRLFLVATDVTWEFESAASGSDRTLYAAGVLPGTPAIGNVRQGTVFGPGSSLTGTLIVPSPSNVVAGVPTDNTVGTYSTTPSAIATAVRSELATELARIDATISSRLASAGYTAPDNSGISAIKAKTDNLPSDPASNTQVNTRLAAASYTAPDNTSITAIKAKTDQITFTSGNVNSIAQVVSDKTGYALTSGERTAIAAAVEAALINDGDGQALINAIVTAIGNQNIDQVLLISAIRADIERAGGMLDGKASQTTASAIKAKTDLLPSDPATETSVLAIKTKTDNLPASPANEVTLGLVKAKTDNLPSDPASTTNVTAVGSLVSAVKAKTDNLPASPADETTLAKVKQNTDLIPAAL